MSRCVPGWDLDGSLKLTCQPNSLSLTPDVPTLDHHVAELTWENGHLYMHSLGQPRQPSNAKYTWDKTCVGGTLESIVDQATFLPNYKFLGNSNNHELVPWFTNHESMLATTTAATTKVTASATGVVDALVPCTNMGEGSSMLAMDSGFGTHVESCSGATVPFEKVRAQRLKVSVANEWSSCPTDNSVSESATFCKDTRQVTVDTCEKEFGAGGFTSISMASPGNTSSDKQCTGEDHDSVCHSKRQRTTVHEQTKKKTNGKSSVSAKRNRAAAVHNQSERKRRDKINQRMKTLQKLVPNSSKPMTMDAYSRMAALYQQLHQNPGPGAKN